MGFITTKEAADKWGISTRRIVKLADEGRIKGARRFNTSWLIPEDATKPADGRTRAAKTMRTASAVSACIQDSTDQGTFRFPQYLNAGENDFVPPLTDEERQLRRAQAAFHACRFDEARKISMPLSEGAQSRYVRIAALYLRCFLAVDSNDIKDHESSLRTFELLLSKDFPYKREMMLLHDQMDMEFGLYNYLLDNLRIEACDRYHPSTHDTLALLSLFSLTNGNLTLYAKLNLDAYELLCLRLEKDGCVFEAQKLHCALLDGFLMKRDNDRVLYHLRRAFEIAIKHELYFHAAKNALYYPDVSREALAEFPDDFAKTIHSIGWEIRAKYEKFMDTQRDSLHWNMLSVQELTFVSYALAEFSNKEIAESEGISVNTVSRRFGAIYAKLGVGNKRELVELVAKTHWNRPADAT